MISMCVPHRPQRRQVPLGESDMSSAQFRLLLQSMPTATTGISRFLFLSRSGYLVVVPLYIVFNNSKSQNSQPQPKINHHLHHSQNPQNQLPLLNPPETTTSKPTRDGEIERQEREERKRKKIEKRERGEQTNQRVKEKREKGKVNEKNIILFDIRINN